MEGLHTSPSGALIEEQRLRVIANDLANLNTPAQRRQRLAIIAQRPQIQASLIRRGDPATTGPPSETPLGDQNFARVDRSEIDCCQGARGTTGRSTDLALQGQGFFVVDVDGEELCARPGAFTVDPAGTLVMRVGDTSAPVLSDTGPVFVGSPDFDVFADGSVQSHDGSTIARLRVVDFDDPQRLARRGNSLFARETGQAALRELDMHGRAVRQRALELSNADAIPSFEAIGRNLSRETETSDEMPRTANDVKR